MDIKEKRQKNYQANKQRIIEKVKEFNKNHKEERQRYNQKYWANNGHIFVKHRNITVDHKAKYQEMKEYYKAHSKTNYEKYGKKDYLKNKDILNEKVNNI
jgi:hypothetical protein